VILKFISEDGMDILVLGLLFIKHWYIDFVNQSDEEVKSKGIYGDGAGIGHSVKHGLGTMGAILVIFGGHYFIFAGTMAIIDAATHYHIDWMKMNYGNRDITNPKFWNHLGLDQMAHNFVYLFITCCISFLIL
jgi:hypothetical protein